MPRNQQGTPPADVVTAPRRTAGISVLRPEHLYKMVGLAFLLALVYKFFGEISQVLLLLYAAAIVAVLLNTIVQLFPHERRLVSALLGVLIVGAIGALVWFGIPALTAQVRDIANRAPEFQAMLRQSEEWIRQQTGLNIQLVGPEAEGFVRDVFRSAAGDGSLMSSAQGLLGVLLVPLLIVFGGLFAVANPNERLLSPVLRAVPRDRRLAARRIFDLLGSRIIGWLRGTLIGMLAVGLLSLILFYLIGVPNALFLAVLSGLLEFIPLVGPWVGGIVATFVAFLDDPTKGIWTALAALGIQQLENNVIIPLAMSREADIHPLVTLFALVLFGTLFGFLGIVLAVPLVLLFWTVIQVLWVERAIDTDRDPIAPVVEE